jgi:hypothetical protein
VDLSQRPKTGAEFELELVPMYHPELDRTVPMPASAVEDHKRAGWLLADPGPAESPPGDHETSGAPADAGASSLQDEPPKRRRASTKED